MLKHWLSMACLQSQAEAERRLASAKREAPPAARPSSAKRSRPGLISSDVSMLTVLAIVACCPESGPTYPSLQLNTTLASALSPESAPDLKWFQLQKQTDSGRCYRHCFRRAWQLTHSGALGGQPSFSGVVRQEEDDLSDFIEKDMSEDEEEEERPKAKKSKPNRRHINLSDSDDD